MVEKEMPAEEVGKNSDELEAVVEVEETTRDDLGRFVVEEPKPEVKVEEPKPAPKPEKPAPKAKSEVKAVEVSLSALSYSDRKRNSLSVSVFQDRLAELGYASVRSDLRGWFHDGTRAAVKKWQEDSRAEVTGEVSLPNAEVIFRGMGAKITT